MSEFLKKNKTILISIGTNLALVLIAIFVIGTRYSTDDDISIARVAFGTWFEPSARIVFSNVVFGMLLKCLWSICPGINWQLIVYYILLCYGGTVGQYYVMKAKRRTHLLAWFLGIATFYYTAYININFSIVSAFLGFLGYVPVFLGVKNKEKIAVVLGGITVAFCAMIRIGSFFAVSAFAGVVFLLLVIPEWKKLKFKQLFVTYFVPFICVVGVSFVLMIIDRVTFLPEQWKEYNDYNFVRTQVLDFWPIFELLPEEHFEELGITPAMANSIWHWQFNDNEKLNMEVMTALSEDSLSFNPKINPDLVFNYVSYFARKVSCHYYYLFAVALLVIFTGKIKKEEKTSAVFNIAPWAVLLPLIVELAVYFYMGRGINRVLETTGCGLWLGMVLVVVLDIACLDEKKIVNSSILAVVILSLICQMSNLSKIEKMHFSDRTAVEKEFEFLQDGRVYVCDIGSIRATEEAYGVWQIPKEGTLKNCIELGGWLVNHPYNLEKQDRLGASNPYKSLIESDNVYLLTTENGKLQLEYLRDAYNENVESEIMEQHGKISVIKYSVK